MSTDWLITLIQIKGNANMKSVRCTATILLVVIFLLLPVTTRPGFSQGSTGVSALDGFTPENAVVERRWEDEFRAVPAPASAREHLRRLTLEPHIAGTKEDYATAVYVRDQLRSYGLAAELKEDEVWLNYP